MAPPSSIPVMDIFPWPNGQGFSGTDVWWQYVHQQDESVQLDFLIGMAAMFDELGQRLLRRDEELLDAFQFSMDTLAWLRSLRANSLQELASAITQRQNSS